MYEVISLGLDKLWSTRKSVKAKTEIIRIPEMPPCSKDKMNNIKKYDGNFLIISFNISISNFFFNKILSRYTTHLYIIEDTRFYLILILLH